MEATAPAQCRLKLAVTSRNNSLPRYPDRELWSIEAVLAVAEEEAKRLAAKLGT